MLRPSPNLVERLRAVGLRPTRQRLALARLLFDGEDRHVTAEQRDKIVGVYQAAKFPKYKMLDDEMKPVPPVKRVY